MAFTEASPSALSEIGNHAQGSRVYDANGVSCTLAASCGGFGGKTGMYAVPIKCKTKLGYQMAYIDDSIDTGYAGKNARRGRVGSQIAHTLTTSDTQACFVDLNMYQKSSFDEDEHAKLFAFMNDVHVKFSGECKFLITYNNDPYIRSLAEKYGFDTYVQERLHNMAQGSKPGEMFEELLIANYDLMQQAVDNHHQLANENSQLSLFDYICDY